MSAASAAMSEKFGRLGELKQRLLFVVGALFVYRVEQTFYLGSTNILFSYINFAILSKCANFEILKLRNSKT